jgi:hypothetical protein
MRVPTARPTARAWEGQAMAQNGLPARVLTTNRVKVPPELAEELRRADEDFERGDYIELTVEQLDRCIATGESPWPDE